ALPLLASLFGTYLIYLIFLGLSTTFSIFLEFFFRFVCNPCVVSVVVITIFWILALCSCVFDLAELMGIFLGNYLGNYYGRG
ncbi:MAG: hypothetical protein ACKPER_27335, partial [Dolichospermum sp.]